MNKRATIAWLMLATVCSCKAEHPFEPAPPPQVSYLLQATLPGQLPGNMLSWSPVGMKLAYESLDPAGGTVALRVFDAQHPTDPPVLVHTGDYSWRICWSPDAHWLLCLMMSKEDFRTGLMSLVAFPATAGGTPQVLVSKSDDIGDVVWAANGKIYFWEVSTGLRRRLEPPPEWTALNARGFPDRPALISVRNPQLQISYPYWFHVAPTEEAVLLAPAATGEPPIAWDLFPDGRRFLETIPAYSSYSAVVGPHGEVITKLWQISPGGNETPFEASAVTSDGQFVVGISEHDVNGYVVSSVLYLADAGARWKVPIEHAPTGWFAILSREGYILAFESLAGDSVYVGELQVTPGTTMRSNGLPAGSGSANVQKGGSKYESSLESAMTGQLRALRGDQRAVHDRRSRSLKWFGSQPPLTGDGAESSRRQPHHR